MIPTHAGIIPDRAPETSADASAPSFPKRVGVFTDEMAQNIITRVVNFQLDAVQLDGHEPATLIRNLRATLTTAANGSSTIAPELQIWKTITVESAGDLALCREYEECCDLFVFDMKEATDWNILQKYDGRLPFLLSGSIGPDDAEALRQFRHPQCVGINLNTCFETAPAVKDVEMLRSFIARLS